MKITRRNLPHLYPPNVVFFITFRLKNSIPAVAIAKLREEKEQATLAIQQNKKLSDAQKSIAIYNEEKRFFGSYDKMLDKYATPDDFLRLDSIAQIVADKMHEYHTRYYDLLAYCIMSNHVHLLFDTYQYDHTDISHIMQLIKGGSGNLCNRVLGRSGSFWQAESYDHYVRNDQELQNIAGYIIQNPVKAGLVDDWQEWKFTYIAPTL
jgi:putative transposase